MRKWNCFPNDLSNFGFDPFGGDLAFRGSDDNSLLSVGFYL